MDTSNSRRIELLLHWWTVSADKRFWELALHVAEHPPAPKGWSGFDSWRDGAELVELTGKIRREDHYPDLPIAEKLVKVLEEAIIHLLSNGLSYDTLESIADAVEDAYPPVSEAVRDATLAAIRREIDEVEISIDSVDSESTLEDHAKTLEKLAPRAGVPPENLATAMAKVKKRIEEIEEETTTADAPSISSQKHERDVFTDAALKSLFATLLDNK